jgi:hypothetical protein
MVDMKVPVTFNFGNFFFEKHEISKFHEKWKISPFEVLGQGSKLGSAIHPFSRNAKPIPILPYNSQKEN